MAVHYQRKFTRGLLLSYTLAVVMGVVFIVYSEFIEQWPLALLFMVLFITGVVFHSVGERRQWHRKYLDYRALAEGLRVQVYWNLAGVVPSRSASFAYDNFLQKQDVDLEWIRHVMRQASMYRLRGVSPDVRWLDWVIRQWVGGRSEKQGQLSYYTRKERENSARFRRTQRLGTLCLWVGIGTAVVLVLLGGRLDDQQKNLLLVLMGVLPLVAGLFGITTTQTLLDLTDRNHPALRPIDNELYVEVIQEEGIPVVEEEPEPEPEPDDLSLSATHQSPCSMALLCAWEKSERAHAFNTAIAGR